MKTKWLNEKLTEEYLTKEYVDKNRSCDSIAKEFGVTGRCVYIRVKRLGIDTSISTKRKRELKTNKKYGDVTVIEKDTKRSKKNYVYYICQCLCGERFSAHNDTLKNSKGCRKCQIKNKRINSNGKATSWKGYGDISGTIWKIIQKSAKDRDLQFEVSIEYIWNLFLKQNRRCVFSGVELTFGPAQRHDGLYVTASLDRIDSKIGYIENNVQWIHKELNIMKQSLSDKKFINWCRLVWEHNR